MQIRYTQLNAELLNSVAIACPTQRVDEATAADCFLLSLRFWQALQKLVKEIGFTCVDEEIAFFSTIKPAFTARLDYYTLLYQSILLLPSENDKVLAFWQTEAARYSRFMLQHAGFMQYLRSGHNYRHREYFTCAEASGRRVHPGRVFDDNANCLTTGDPLLALFFAHTWYHRYVSHRLRKFEAGELP